MRVILIKPSDTLILPGDWTAGVAPFRRRRHIMATVVYLVVGAFGVVFLALSLVTFESSDPKSNRK